MPLTQIIGMVHFSPLEGDPKFPGKDTVFRRAQEDLAVLLAGGVDAVMFENNFDNPKCERLPEKQAAHFLSLVDVLTKNLVIPWGVSALWNDYGLGFACCKKFGGTMVRVPVFVDSVETVYGSFFADPDRVLARRRELGAAHVQILADVQVKHANILSPRPLRVSVLDAIEHKADGVIITGTWTGNPPTVEQVRESKAVSGERAKLFIGSGMTAENVKEFLPFIDGCIVGTAFKKTAERIAGGPNVFGPEVRYDVQKVRTFVQSVHGA